MEMIALVIISLPVDRKAIPPIGLLYVGNSLKMHGYDVQIFHLIPDEITKYAKKIVKKNPIFVGFSVVTGNQVKFSLQLSREIKKISDVPIVWGGPHPSIFPIYCLKEKSIDIVIRGEGEESSAELANALKEKKDLKEIKGIGYKRGEKIILTEERELIRDLDAYKADWNLIKIKDYLQPQTLWDCKKVLVYVSSRGCPHNCAFCYNLILNKRVWRCHSKEFVISDIERLKAEHDVDGVLFYDDNFFVNRKRVFEIINKIKLPWGAELRLDYVNEKLGEKLKETDVKCLLFGTESGSDRCLKLMNKGVTVKDTIRSAKILKTIPDFHPKHSFILGIPTETWEETQMTIDLIVELHEIDDRSLFTVGPFLPYLKTPLYDLAVKNGFKPPMDNWEKMDRWTGELELSWLDWADRRTFLLIRNYSKYLHLTADYNIPLISRIAHYRLSKKNFFFPIEHEIMEWIFRNVIEKTGGFFGRLIKSR